MIRLIVHVSGGVVQAIETPDTISDIEIILNDEDNGETIMYGVDVCHNSDWHFHKSLTEVDDE